ncbi:hypothetical protein SAMN04488074_10595 [Lentzea albidocapillata subsp. violacea]|uniref:Uncharacterized protein n=1 Tax=Lentzea albidocapillata subsp. violacea TaxID=128104 RepID=A0A1G9AT86_9PSEU|nr:hypothetical protein [Lentzea albidocapillata]SDK29775.1 hypothetical protein SAMN04488074_10595 [Lentzea albidocapillata subsp. violacea]
MNRIAASVLTALLVLSGTACSSPSTGTSSSTGSSSDARPADAAAPVETKATPKTAKDVTEALVGKIPSLTLAKVFTAEDDPNRQLGRPNSYTSKTFFTDSRIAAELLEFAKENDPLRGGSVEVFETEALATARKNYIQEFGKTTPLLAEYNYVVGGVLLRVSKELTPAQAKEYETALNEILG